MFSLGKLEKINLPILAANITGLQIIISITSASFLVFFIKHKVLQKTIPFLMLTISFSIVGYPTCSSLDDEPAIRFTTWKQDVCVKVSPRFEN